MSSKKFEIYRGKKQVGQKTSKGMILKGVIRVNCPKELLASRSKATLKDINEQLKSKKIAALYEGKENVGKVIKITGTTNNGKKFAYCQAVVKIIVPFAKTKVITKTKALKAKVPKKKEKMKSKVAVKTKKVPRMKDIVKMKRKLPPSALLWVSAVKQARSEGFTGKLKKGSNLYERALQIYNSGSKVKLPVQPIMEEIALEKAMEVLERPTADFTSPKEILESLPEEEIIARETTMEEEIPYRESPGTTISDIIVKNAVEQRNEEYLDQLEEVMEEQEKLELELEEPIEEQLIDALDEEDEKEKEKKIGHVLALPDDSWIEKELGVMAREIIACNDVTCLTDLLDDFEESKDDLLMHKEQQIELLKEKVAEYLQIQSIDINSKYQHRMQILDEMDKEAKIKISSMAPKTYVEELEGRGYYGGYRRRRRRLRGYNIRVQDGGRMSIRGGSLAEYKLMNATKEKYKYGIY